MKRVLVTGATGFVGKRTTPLLLSRGYAVIGLARSDTAEDALLREGAEIVRGDLNDPAALTAAFQTARADALINIASLGFGYGPDIVNAAVAAQIQRCVFVSTTAIFTTLNVQTKAVRLEAERAISESRLDFTILRPTMIYGAPDDRNLARMLRILKKSPVFPLVGGKRLHQPVHVEDVAAALIGALEAPTAIGGAYDIAGPTPLQFADMVGEAAKAVPRRVIKIPLPLKPVVAAFKVYERVSSRPRLTSEQFERLGEDKAFDISAAEAAFDYRPREFRDGISDEATLLFRSEPG